MSRFEPGQTVQIVETEQEDKQLLADTFPGIDFSDLGLSAPELRFVTNLSMLGMSRAGDAYAASGFAEKPVNKTHAHTLALRCMGLPHVREAIKRYSASVIEPAADRFTLMATQFWEARAFWNPRDFFNDNHTAKTLDQIPQHLLLCIDGIKFDKKGKDGDAIVTNIDLPNRSEAIKALEALFDKERPKRPLPKSNITRNVKEILDRAKTQPNPKTTIERTTERITVEGDDDATG